MLLLHAAEHAVFQADSPQHESGLIVATLKVGHDCSRNTYAARPVEELHLTLHQLVVECPVVFVEPTPHFRLLESTLLGISRRGAYLSRLCSKMCKMLAVNIFSVWCVVRQC